MTLQKKIQDDLKVSLKAKDSARTGAVRILLGEFQRLPDKELSDDQVISIIKKLIKSEKELLAAKNEQNSDFLTVIESYMPKMASEEEIRKWIEENIDFSTLGNKMQAMKPIMAHFGSSADGNLVKQVLNQMG